MKIYLDDDIAAVHLARLLVRAGHDVQRPVDVGMSGQDDSVHLTHTVRDGRIILTRNHHDFENLHNLVITVQGRHPGILVVRKDNDPNRDLRHPGIVRAIANLLASGLPFSDSLHIPNHWRWTLNRKN